MAARVLLVEDDSRLAAMVETYLGEAGYAVTRAGDGRSAIDRHRTGPFDLVILDLMLPDIDGLDVCRTIRAGADTPILMLTARGDAMDRVIGLEMGADDYLPKPFEPRELLARIKAILRRGRGPQSSEVLRFGRLEIDVAARQARLGDAPVEFTSYQFALLLELARHAGRVMSRDALMDLLRSERLEAFDRSIDIHVSRIRQVIEDNPKKPRRIITVRGSGYVFAKAQD